MIGVICPYCGLRILVPPTVQGRTGLCFSCGKPLRVPVAQISQAHLNLSFDPGDRVSERYIVERAIGRGGMGVVYCARDTLINESVALKFMNPRMLQTEKGRQLFIQEAQIARRLRHENIVAVHDVASTNEGILYLSMELVEGNSMRASLRDYRKERRLVPVRLAVSYVLQMLLALEYAHRTVIHRDIKPENVMISAGERVKVLDFGLAKAVHEELISAGSGADGPAKQEEKKGGVVGTLAYAAPEQKRKQNIDLRADLYAVGLVFHELLTLRTPMDKPVTVPEVRNDVSPALHDVLRRALEEEKERRWHDAGAFRAALESAYETGYRKAAAAPAAASRGARPGATKGMVHFEGGSFLMGNNEVREEAPEEEVFVKPFWMDIYPVTVADFARYLKETGDAPPKYWHDPQYNGANQPVIGVSWAQAAAYAAWAGKQLPSETQWEFAARGRENRRYPWGRLPPDTTRCNFDDYLGMPSIVTMHEDGKTPEGLHDMAGNVMEWTLDAYLPYELARRGSRADSPRRAVRGGSWRSAAHEVTTTARQGLFPESQLPTLGFRCVIPDA